MSICKHEVFEQVYFEHIESLRNFLYYKCGNLKLAEDLSQDSFAKLWSNCAKVTTEKAKSFVFTIAKNLFLNHVKHEKIVLNFSKKNKTGEDTLDPQTILEEKELKLKIEKAISTLPENQRVVFLMNRIDKMTYREIALSLNLSVKAVEKRMHKALKILKEVINQPS